MSESGNSGQQNGEMAGRRCLDQGDTRVVCGREITMRRRIPILTDIVETVQARRQELALENQQLRLELSAKNDNIATWDGLIALRNNQIAEVNQGMTGLQHAVNQAHIHLGNQAERIQAAKEEARFLGILPQSQDGVGGGVGEEGSSSLEGIP